MKLIQTEIEGVYEILADPQQDDRGFFARVHCEDTLSEAGINFTIKQANLSRNTSPFTLRGMHWQEPPYSEAKIVRATNGCAYDVVIDLRPGSLTFRKWIARTLDAEKCNALLIPEGCAHGFMTISPGTDILYLMNRSFVPGHAKGLRWDDEFFCIAWPAKPLVISQADQSWPSPWGSFKK